MTRPGLAGMARGGVDAGWYFAWVAQQGMDPRDMTLSSIRALFGRGTKDGRPPERPPASGGAAFGSLGSYADVLRHVFRTRGETPDRVEELVREHLKGRKAGVR